MNQSEIPLWNDYRPVFNMTEGQRKQQTWNVEGRHGMEDTHTMKMKYDAFRWIDALIDHLALYTFIIISRFIQIIRSVPPSSFAFHHCVHSNISRITYISYWRVSFIGIVTALCMRRMSMVSGLESNNMEWKSQAYIIVLSRITEGAVLSIFVQTELSLVW